MWGAFAVGSTATKNAKLPLRAISAYLAVVRPSSAGIPVQISSGSQKLSQNSGTPLGDTRLAPKVYVLGV